MKYLRLHHVMVYIGLAAGLAIAVFVETEPAFLGWTFGLGGGLAGGAFLAALVSGEQLAGGPQATGSRRRSNGTSRPAWFDEDTSPSSSNGRREEG